MHRIEGLDLLRGFAILLVLIRHSWPQYVGGGGLVGVVVFFTLSGYLITGLLTADIRTYGRVRYGRFYRNRAIRLLPALAFLLVGFVIVEGVLNVLGTRDEVWRSVLVAVTYTANIPGFDHGSPSLDHLWTLANEEQFYLVWPLLLALGIRFRRLRLVVALSAVALIGMLVASVAVTPAVAQLYTLPSTWTISMIVGAAAQLGQRRIDRWLRGWHVNAGAVVAVIGLLGLSLVPGAKSSVPMTLLGGTAIGILTVLLIWKLRTVSVVPRPARPLLWLGMISYAAYLWNSPITWWLRGLDVPFWEPVAIALTVVAAGVSWFAVERPFTALKHRLDARARLRELDPVFVTARG